MHDPKQDVPWNLPPMSRAQVDAALLRRLEQERRVREHNAEIMRVVYANCTRLGLWV